MMEIFLDKSKNPKYSHKIHIQEAIPVDFLVIGI